MWPYSSDIIILLYWEIWIIRQRNDFILHYLFTLREGDKINLGKKDVKYIETQTFYPYCIHVGYAYTWCESTFQYEYMLSVYQFRLLDREKYKIQSYQNLFLISILFSFKTFFFLHTNRKKHFSWERIFSLSSIQSWFHTLLFRMSFHFVFYTIFHLQTYIFSITNVVFISTFLET